MPTRRVTFAFAVRHDITAKAKVASRPKQRCPRGKSSGDVTAKAKRGCWPLTRRRRCRRPPLRGFHRSTRPHVASVRPTLYTPPGRNRGFECLCNGRVTQVRVSMASHRGYGGLFQCGVLTCDCRWVASFARRDAVTLPGSFAKRRRRPTRLIKDSGAGSSSPGGISPRDRVVRG